MSDSQFILYFVKHFQKSLHFFITCLKLLLISDNITWHNILFVIMLVLMFNIIIGFVFEVLFSDIFFCCSLELFLASNGVLTTFFIILSYAESINFLLRTFIRCGCIRCCWHILLDFWAIHDDLCVWSSICNEVMEVFVVVM